MMYRRTFLQASAAAATVLASGVGIQGCGETSERNDDGGSDLLDPSKTHTTRFYFKQPVFDLDAATAALPEAERNALLSFLPLSTEGSVSIANAETFVFHAGGAKMMTRLQPAVQRGSQANTIHIATQQFSTDKTSIIYVTHKLNNTNESGDEGLSFMYLYLPSLDSGNNRSCSSDSDMNASAESNTTVASCEVDVEVTIDDPVFETIKALLFLHPALHQIRVDRARALLSSIDITDLEDYSILYNWLSAGMQCDCWYSKKSLNDPDNETVLAYHNGPNKGKAIYQFLPLEEIMQRLRSPMRDMIRRAGNNPDLDGIFKHDVTASDRTDRTESRMRRFVNSRSESSGSTITLQDHSERDGYKIELKEVTTFKEAFGTDYLPEEAPVVKLTLKNHYRRYIAFYIQYLDLDGNVIETKTVKGETGRNAWNLTGGNQYSKGIYDDYMDDKSYLLKLLTHPAELLGIPIEEYTEAEAEFGIPDGAQSVNVYAVTFGSSGKHIPLMEHLPVGMTWTFDMIIPLFLLASSFAIRNEKEWIKLLAEYGLEFALSFIKFMISHSANAGGNSAAKLMELAGEVGTAILLKIIRKGVEKLAIFLVEEITEESIEDSTPILGAALMVGNIAVDAAEIAQTGFAINNSAWSSSFAMSRTHSVQLQVLPDENNFQFPEVADSVTLILKSPKGKVNMSVKLNKSNVVQNVKTSQIDGKSASGDPLFSAEGSDTTEALIYTFKEVPEGGKIDVIALFTAGEHGYVVGHAKYRIDNIGEVKTAFRIKQIKIALTEQSIYSHKRISRYEGGVLKWIETPTAPTTLYNLASDGTEAGQISKLLSISINDKSGALGYSFTTEIDGTFKTIAKNISAKMDAPTEGLKDHVYASDTNAFVLYDMLGEPKTENIHFILQLKYDPLLKQNTYFAKAISIDPASGSFNMSPDKNRGKFRTVIDAAAYDATHGVIAGIDKTRRRLHILTLSEEDLEDSDETENGSVYSVPRNIVGAGESTDIDTLPDVLFAPQVVAFTATGALMIVDQTPAGHYARIFSSNGTALDYPLFGGFYKALKTENESVTYLDISVDAEGYFFILKRLGGGLSVEDYRLDLYKPDGTFLSQTSGVAAHKMRSDFWRNIYTLNYEQTTKDGSYNEPTVSIWAPPVTEGKVIADYE